MYAKAVVRKTKLGVTQAILKHSSQHPSSAQINKFFLLPCRNTHVAPFFAAVVSCSTFRMSPSSTTPRNQLGGSQYSDMKTTKPPTPHAQFSGLVTLLSCRRGWRFSCPIHNSKPLSQRTTTRPYFVAPCFSTDMR